MLKKLLLTVFGLLAIVGTLVLMFVLMILHLKAAFAGQGIPATAVATATVSAESWQRLLPSVGTVSAVQGVTVAAQLDGQVVAIDFQPGTKVKQGDLLVQQDISAEKAQLQAQEAAVDLARVNLRRSSELLRQNTISRSQFDSDQAAYDEAKAQAENIRATIEKKTIRAPFSGWLGVRQVNLGQVLKAGDPIVSLQSLQPVYVDFYVPQDMLAELSRGLAVDVRSDAFPGSSSQGRLTTIDPQIDAATRNLHLEATLPNPDEHLRPGMFVDVNVVLPGMEHVLAVPLTAVQYAPYGNSVFVVEKQKDPQTGQPALIVRQQIVRLGTTRGDFVAVDSGLQAGETVVSEGGFKLRPGMTVSVHNALAPDAQLNPHPSDS